jgi:glycosyltransferase involved in cell wall biosynthesis
MGLALSRAARIFAESDSRKRLAISLGAARDGVMVIGNGVDTAKFFRVPRPAARDAFALPQDAPVIVSVGALTERKGFHRVMECIPSLRQRVPGLRYMVVGGPGPEGDWADVLRRRAVELRIDDCVIFTGALPPDRLKVALSAADVFVLATSNEGWANVLLEAMACGLPIVTTDVGGNAEVVAHPGLGTVVPFGDHVRLCDAIHHALAHEWNRDAIVAHAAANHWDGRIASLVQEFTAIVEVRSGAGTTGPTPRDSLSHP